jgi:diamine N-acetyltransferase
MVSSVCDPRIQPLRQEDIDDLLRLARDIWHRHYPGIITVQQIEYMLAQRYRRDLILAQLTSGTAWWDKLMVDGNMIAFTSYERGESVDDLKLDKLYVRYDLRGHGYGTSLLQHVERRAAQLQCRRVYLQVNKHNDSAIAAYRRNGYVIERAVCFDIGNGFVMDDYIMAKPVKGET